MTQPKLDSVIFDLDGTLWDATVASALGWTRAARAHGHDRTIMPAQIGTVCGLPFDECIDKLFGDLPEAALRQLAPDLASYEEAAVRERGGDLYPGVPEGLRALAARVPIFILSNCHRWYLELFMTSSGLGELFRENLCFGDTNLPKGENMARMASRHGLQAAVYVGDTAGDQVAAEQAGCGFVYAAYGFGDVVGAPPFEDFGSVCRELHALAATQ